VLLVGVACVAALGFPPCSSIESARLLQHAPWARPFGSRMDARQATVEPLPRQRAADAGAAAIARLLRLPPPRAFLLVPPRSP
jgi:hypothetical protein